MWSSPALNSRIAAAILVLLMTVALSGCGFQPLYGRSSESGESVTDKLAQIKIRPLQHRVGQRMHNLLRDRLNPLGQPAAPDYILTVSVTEKTKSLGIRSDATATRANLTMDVTYILRHVGETKDIFEARARSTNSFDIIDTPYAESVSEDNARERALESVADEIKNRLAIHLSRPAEAAEAE